MGKNLAFSRKLAEVEITEKEKLRLRLTYMFTVNVSVFRRDARMRFLAQEMLVLYVEPAKEAVPAKEAPPVKKPAPGKPAANKGEKVKPK